VQLASPGGSSAALVVAFSTDVSLPEIIRADAGWRNERGDP
jgi:hypothetical protein